MQRLSLLVFLLLCINTVCAHLVLHIEEDATEHSGTMFDCNNRRLQKIEEDLAEIKANLTELRAKSENTAIPKKGCKDGWVIYQESCYFFGNTELSFAAAQSFCVSSYNAHLANIETATKNTFIRDFLRRMNVTADLFWFGLTDEKTENVWRHFPSGVQATFLAWGSGEPNAGTYANCAALWKGKDYMWVDDPCDRQMRYICEKQAQ